MILDVIQLGDERLHQRSEEIVNIDKSIKKIIENMIDTMYFKSGIGLAAVQVGILKRMFVIDIEEVTNGPMVFINPVVNKKFGSKVYMDEGCLSISQVFGEVKRESEVLIEYLDMNGNKKELKTDGILARCIMHECDHLEGVLFIDYAEDDVQKGRYNECLIKGGFNRYF